MTLLLLLTDSGAGAGGASPQTISLPVVDDSAIYGPGVSGEGDISLPLIDGSAVYGPTASTEEIIGLPMLDGSELFGPTLIGEQFLTVPLIDAGWPFAPTFGSSSSGLEVRIGATVLGDAFARSWLDELPSAGSWRFSLANDDPEMPAFDDIVTFSVDGQVRFAGPVEAKNPTMYAPGEEADEVTQLSGRGRLAVTNRSVIGPSRGWDALPVEVVRSLSWVSVDFDDSGWSRAARTRRADTLTPFSPGSRAIPEWWPDKTAWWVAPVHPDVTPYEAPPGPSLYRSDPITLDAGTIAVFSGFNNFGVAYFDGAEIAEVQNNPNDGHRVDFDVSAGEHIFAARVTNYIRDTGFIGAIYTVDADGLLDELVWSSDSDNMRALGYPATMPGFTPGEAIRLLLEEAQADGELLDVTLGFTDTLDSDGEPWQRVVEITTDVGRTFLEFVESLADWLIDVQMAPGANVLRAWDWGTRGGTPGVTIAATTDPDISEVEGLSFSGLHIRANRLRIRYKHGYSYVDESGTDPTVTAFLDLSDVEAESSAQTIARGLLELRKDPSYAGTLTLAPVSSQPYDTFDNGDTVTHPADPAAQNSSRVRSIACIADDESDELTWVLKLNDVRQETWERQENWLKRSAMGALAGGARVTSRRGDAIAPAERVAAKDVAEFSFDGEPSEPLSLVRAASNSGNLIEVHVTITLTDDGVPTSTATEFDVFLGTTNIATVTVPAGETQAEEDLAIRKVYRNVTTLRVELVSFPAEARGVDIQVRAI